jgi:hypothetical protein
MRKRTAGAFFVAAFLGAILLLPGCKKKEAPVATTPEPTAYPATAPEAPAAGARLERIVVSRSVNSDDSPGAVAASFGKNDTVYVSIWRSNVPTGAEITARWFGPDGAQITEDKQVTPAGDGYTSFHAADTKGWAPGSYRIEILLNGQATETVTFMVG